MNGRTYLLSCLALIPLSVAVAEDASPTAGVAKSDRIQLVRNVAYTKRDEQKPLLADVYLPEGEGPFPTVLMIHGGAWMSGRKEHVMVHARYAAQHGYAVVAINYRLAPIHRFPAQLEDCEAAARWIASGDHNFPFNTAALATYGYSAGAQLACLVGLSPAVDRPQIRAVVAGGTPCEFSWIPAERKTLAYWLGGSRLEVPDQYQQASPVTFVDAKDPPVYLYHGERDRVVPVTSPRKLQQRLEQHQVDVHLHLVRDKGHLGAFMLPDCRHRAIAFLDTQLNMAPDDPTDP